MFRSENDLGKWDTAKSILQVKQRDRNVSSGGLCVTEQLVEDKVMLFFRRQAQQNTESCAAGEGPKEATGAQWGAPCSKPTPLNRRERHTQHNPG